MTLEEAIEVRISRRKYLPTPIDPEKVQTLRIMIKEYCQQAGLNIQLVLDNAEAFQGLRRSYGMFSGVRHYIGLIGHDQDPHCIEKLGYYGEKLVLHATTMGLGTCWVAGTFDRRACPISLSEHERIACTITIGNVEDTQSGKEKLIRRLTHRKTKSVEEMFTADSTVPDWFMAGMRAVRRAPSAVNRQPVCFSYSNGIVSASVPDPEMAMDLGIAKTHFEIGADGGSWSFGPNAQFRK